MTTAQPLPEQPPAAAAPTPDPTISVWGFKARYLNGGTELVSKVQGKAFFKNRQITIGVVHHLLASEQVLVETRDALYTPDGLPISEHARFVGMVYRGVVERVGASLEQRLCESTNSETMLSEYMLAVSEKLRGELEAARRTLETERHEHAAFRSLAEENILELTGQISEARRRINALEAGR